MDAGIDANSIRQRLTSARRIVVKTGSVLVADGGAARRGWLAQLAADIFDLRQNGAEVVLVSSGAIALGRRDLSLEAPARLEQKQAAAAVGQLKLMAALGDAFQAHNITVAQSLLTLSDTETRRRWLNARATLDTLLAAGILPIINENDTVATDEIRYGDNDRLAARVAQMLGADVLILLSDVDGLYTADPHVDTSATHIPLLTELSPQHKAMAAGANPLAQLGSGGMATKLMAAEIALSAGCATVITIGDRKRPIGALHDGARHTLIQPDLSPAKAREIWLSGHLTPEGAIDVDAGAAAALAQGASLLPVGITGTEGTFERGAAVAIRGPSATVIAKGITAYSAVDIRRIAGLQSDAVEAALGAPGRTAVIHRDDMVRV